VQFKPDKSIFADTRFDYDVIRQRLRELAFLNSEVTIELQREAVSQNSSTLNQA